MKNNIDTHKRKVDFAEYGSRPFRINVENDCFDNRKELAAIALMEFLPALLDEYKDCSSLKIQSQIVEDLSFYEQNFDRKIKRERKYIVILQISDQFCIDAHVERDARMIAKQLTSRSEVDISV